jgi:hypothetical protein
MSSTLPLIRRPTTFSNHGLQSFNLKHSLRSVLTVTPSLPLVFHCSVSLTTFVPYPRLQHAVFSHLVAGRPRRQRLSFPIVRTHSLSPTVILHVLHCRHLANMAEVETPHVSAPTALEPEDVPLPRSSMVSVRLSDIPFDPDLDIISEREPSQVVSTPRSDGPSTRTSRASSQTSESSISMHSVNWEGLEKTEEQERKDEDTDEVRTCSTIMWNNPLTSFRSQHYFWLDSRKKTLPLLSIPRLVLQRPQHPIDLAKTHVHRRCIN